MSVFLYWPLLVKASFLPSGEKSGSNSPKSGVLVMLRRWEPSGLTVQMSPLSTKAILSPSGDQVGLDSWSKSPVSFFCPEPSAFITQTSARKPSEAGSLCSLLNAISVPSGDQAGLVSERLLSVRAFLVLALPERLITQISPPRAHAIISPSGE